MSSGRSRRHPASYDTDPPYFTQIPGSGVPSEYGGEVINASEFMRWEVQDRTNSDDL